MSIIAKNILAQTRAAEILHREIESGKSISVKGLAGSLKALLLVYIAEQNQRDVLIVLPEEEDAERLMDEISLMSDCRVGLYPEGEESPDTPYIINPRRAGMQTSLLRDMVEDRMRLVITTPAGTGYRLPEPVWFKNQCLQLSSGGSYEIYELVEKLIKYGYTRESMIEKPGEISLRGGILDIYPFTGEPPYRFEFFGNEIDSIREVDIETQRSREVEASVTISPTSLFWKKRESFLFSYLDNPIVFLQDKDLILGKIDHTYHSKEPNFVSSGKILDRLDHYQIINYHTLKAPEKSVDFGAVPWVRSGDKSKDIRQQLYRLSRSFGKIYLVCENTSQKERLRDFLDLDTDFIPNLHFIQDTVVSSFLVPELKKAFITANEIFGKRHLKRKKPQFTSGIPLRELSALQQGDYVVHIDHGIGIYEGLEKISVKDSTRECLKILYQDGDVLYVSVDKMQRVQKYSGREGYEPQLSRLGSTKWERTKQKTRESLEKITEELIKLYSQRQTINGFAFSPDTVWQQELEETFEYEETPDQKEVIAVVKRNMESPRAMDRLISGDVGFGKTEVAVRAAFKAVNDSKQVAMLVPTTILAQQHFSTFKKRLSRFPVKIEVLSRFQTKTKQKKIITGLKERQVDIVIGTHRLFSTDVQFNDLGLLIIDEEQRFGVRHKEKIKMLKTNVDVLALSATPIPRTLQFSLLGIRDMSQINTAPEHRLPIITEVVPFQEQIIIEAVRREISRGGQVFFVHNRVQSIHAVAEMIKRLVPEVRLGIAHGQMREKELEKVMIDFSDKQYDCLVATMIIESGLDLPNANTLIVHRADRLGLGQMYQLRGRVGRSDKRAYAYLLTPPFHLLTRDALRRLRTIEEFTELGSGLQIALRDLEIRGAGNLLGFKQSGNIDAVGFDLYMKLVNETVQKLKQEKAVSEAQEIFRTQCTVDVELPAYIPETYVNSESQRVNLYRSLAAVSTLEEIKDFQEELRDRFGVIPQECNNLIKTAVVRIMAETRGIKKIHLESKKLTMLFDKKWSDTFASEELLSEKLSTMVNSSPQPIHFIQHEGLGVEVDIKDDEPFSFTKKMLQSWS